MLNTFTSLQRRGVKIYVLNILGGDPVDMDSWLGRLIIAVLGSMAEGESELRSERVREARAIRSAKGLSNGGTMRVLFRQIIDGKKRRLVPCVEQRKHSR